MGRLVVEQITSADGYAEDAAGGMGFLDPDAWDGIQDDEQLRFLRGVDAVLLGRRTYEQFASFWPAVTEEQEVVAPFVNGLPKHVVTSTLTDAPWGDHAPAHVEAGSPADVVRRLKGRYDGDLVLWGSLTLADALFREGEVDVLRLRVVPALAGSGRGTTPAGLGVRRLSLASVHQHPGGPVTLQYDVVPASP